MNYATKRLLDAANASLSAWEDEENSVREEHREMIDELEAAIHYFNAHGATQVDEDHVGEHINEALAPRDEGDLLSGDTELLAQAERGYEED